MLTLIKKYKKMDRVQRVKLTSTVSMIYNFINAGSKIFFGLFSAFYFVFVSGLYSLCMGLGKRIYFYGRNKSNDETQKEIKYYRYIGIIVLVAAVCYIGYMFQYLFFPSELKRYGTLTSIAMVAVSGVEITLAVSGILRARKDKDLLMEGLKFVNLVSSLVAVVTAEAVLLTFIKAKNAAYVNGLFGLTLGVISAVVGVCMIVKAAFLKRSFCRMNPAACGLADDETENGRAVKKS